MNELIERDPERYRITANGSTQDLKTGRIVKAPPPGQNTFDDPERAREAARTRIERARAAAHAGLRNASHVGTTALETWSKIVEAQARLAMDGKRGRDSTNAAKFVGTAAGYTGREALEDQKISREGSFIHFSGDIAHKILDMIHEYNKNNGTN